MRRPKPLDGLYRYATFDALPDYVALGWLPVAQLGPWSVLVRWLCECEARIPCES
jgi:hypothetical protein